MKQRTESELMELLRQLPGPGEARKTRSRTFGLLVPPSPFVVPTGWEWVHRAPFEGPSIVASLCRGLGFGFSLLDRREDFDPETSSPLLDEIDILGVACYEDSFPYQRRVIALAKEALPARPVILGGPLVTSAPALLLGNTEADFAVLGEAELTLPALLLALEEGAKPDDFAAIEGLAWRTPDGAVVLNPPRRPLRDLDLVPLQDLSVWQTPDNPTFPELYLSASRGCPHACTFCFRTMPVYRRKTPARVAREVAHLAGYGFRHVWWNDLCFTVDPVHTKTLLETISPLHSFSFNIFDRVTDADPQALAALAAAGCDIVLYGFESVTPDILHSYNKGIAEHDMTRAIALTSTAGIKVGGLFIIGAPEETPASLTRTVEFCARFREITRVKYLSALPGTPLYRRALAEGLITDELAHLDFLSREQSIEEDVDEEGFLLFTPHVTREELRAAYRAINGVIEHRPYDYTRQSALELAAPKPFSRRKHRND